MSYVGLFSYDNFENWMYLPSFTSDNTPWFFNGMRLQIFPTDTLKIEPWLINGWQTYGKFNEMPGFGAQILWRPTEWLSMLSNDYVGWDTQDTPGLIRCHSDNSVEVRYYNAPEAHLRPRPRSRSPSTSAASRATASHPSAGTARSTGAHDTPRARSSFSAG